MHAQPSVRLPKTQSFIQAVSCRAVCSCIVERTAKGKLRHDTSRVYRGSARPVHWCPSMVNAHVSDTGIGVHHKVLIPKSNMWSGVPWILWLYMSVILVVVCIIVELMCSKEKMVVKTFQKKETKHGFCFVARTWMENGSDQMCDRIEQFLGYIGLTCQFLSLTPLHKCLYAMTISF